MNGRSGLFWRIYYLLYWGMALGAAVSVALSVTYAVFWAPQQAAAASTTLDQASCRSALQTQHQALKQRVGVTLSESSSPERMLSDWRDFSMEWQSDLTQLKLRCDLKNPAHKELKALIHDIERMNLAYTTALTTVADLSKKSMVKIEQAFGDPASGSSHP